MVRLPSERFDLTAFAQAIEAQRQARDLSWAAALREINHPFRDVPHHRPIAVSTVAGLTRGKRLIEGDSALQVCLWLDASPERFVAGIEEGPEHGLDRLESHLILRWDLARLFRALDTERRDRSLSWASLATSFGTTPAVLKRLEKGGRSALPQLMDWVLWVGVPASNFTRASPR